MLNWERLRVMAAVAEHGSIGAAAAALHVTGPAVTQQIRKLERETGSALVEPDGRGVRLTAAGHIAAAAAHRMARIVSEVEHALTTLHGQAVGPLRIGALNSTFGLLLGPALHLLADRHPGLVPSARTGEAVDMVPLLASRDLDLVLVENWSTMPVRVPPRVRLEPLVVHDVTLAVGTGHPLSTCDTVALDQIRGQVWTACRPGTDNHDAQLQAMRLHGIEPDIRFVVDDFHTQMTVVASGLAVTLVPRPAVEGSPGVRLVPVTPALTRTIAIATRDGDAAPGVEALVLALKDVAQAISAQP
jgi:DNA-binding transcriptional LysR family regulator